MEEMFGGEVWPVLQALRDEHITKELYRQWEREAAQEVCSSIPEDADQIIDPSEVHRIVVRRTLLHLAERTTGDFSDSFRAAAGERWHELWELWEGGD